MSFDHGGLMHDINDNLAVMRKSQPQVMASFGQLARAAMAEGALSAKHKELMAPGHWGQPALLGLCGVSCEGLDQAGLQPCRARGDVGCGGVHGRRAGVDVRG
jgi:hypothetical protein